MNNRLIVRLLVIKSILLLLVSYIIYNFSFFELVLKIHISPPAGERFRTNSVTESYATNYTTEGMKFNKIQVFYVS